MLFTLFLVFPPALLVQGASIEERLSKLEGQMSSVESRLTHRQLQTTAAFSVRLSDDYQMTDAPVIFDRVDLNIGDGYEPSTGKVIFLQTSIKRNRK